MNDREERYLAALHAMQSGVAMTLEVDPSDTTPKHLRVGVNSALVDSATIVKLLIAKGVFTAEEHMAALADQMQVEAALYEARLSEILGTRVRLA